MIKISAYRSHARRAALYKRATEDASAGSSPTVVANQAPVNTDSTSGTSNRATPVTDAYNTVGKYYKDTFGSYAHGALGGTVGLLGGLGTAGLHMLLSQDARKNKLRTLILHLAGMGAAGFGAGRLLGGVYGPGLVAKGRELAGKADSHIQGSGSSPSAAK